MATMGFCTAPRRERTPTSTIDSNHVGSSHETFTPSPTPSPMSPAAARSAAALYSANVRLPPPSSAPESRAGRGRDPALHELPQGASLEVHVALLLIGRSPGAPLSRAGV